MTKLDYWQRRFLAIEENRGKLDQRYLSQMNKRYNELVKNMEKEIEAWVAKYAENDEITIEAAEQLLSKKEQRQWSMTLKEFRRKAIDGGYDQELNREYYNSRITRLQQLRNQLILDLAEQANVEAENLEAYLAETLDETHLRMNYELMDRGQLELRFERYNEKSLHKALYTNWVGSNFSKRVWNNHLNHIPDKLSHVLSNGMAQGWSIDRMVKEMMVNIDSNLRNRMVTLVQTESAHIAEVASQKAYKERSIKKYQWLATLETSTCKQCAGYDLKIYVVGAKNAKEPIVDSHPNCRCTTVPYIEGHELTKRWSRNPKTGRGEHVKAVSFEVWKRKVA